MFSFKLAKKGDKSGKKQRELLILIFSILSAGKIQGIEFEKLWTLKASPLPEYTFFQISDIATDEQGNLYISDVKGCFVRKYSPDGRSLAEFGRRGSGPGEFLSPVELYYRKGRLYIRDSQLKRITVLDKNLNLVKTIKTRINIWSFVVGETGFICSTASTKDDHLLASLNFSGEVVKKFFDKLPSYLNAGKKSPMHFIRKLKYAVLWLDRNPKSGEVVATHRGYENGNYVYFFDSDMKLKSKCRLNLEKGYSFPSFMLKFPPKYPAESIYAHIYSIHFVNEKEILLHLVKDYMKKGKVERKTNRFLILNRKGEVVYEKQMEGPFRVYAVRNDKIYLKDFAREEEEILQVWRIKR